MLVGKATLRHPDGTDQLVPWDVVCFPHGPAGAHQVSNDTNETVRVLMYSTIKHPAVTVYPDGDKIGVWTREPRRRPDRAPIERRRLLVRRADAVALRPRITPDHQRGSLTGPAHGSILVPSSAAQGRVHLSRAAR